MTQGRRQAGAVDNIRDLLYLRGVDIALTNADVLEHFKTVEKIPIIEKRVHYVTELYIGDIHILVRPRSIPTRTSRARR